MSKRVSLLLGVGLCLVAGMVVRAQSPPSKEQDDVARLRATYSQKRADALKPVNAWYETQLESLRKKMTQKGDLDGALRVKAEQDAMKDLPDGDRDEFRKALVSTEWGWSDYPDRKGAVKTTFHRDPLVTHQGLAGVWQITGPHEVTIVDDKIQQKIVLKFDKKVVTFQGELTKLGEGNKTSPVYGARW